MRKNDPNIESAKIVIIGESMVGKTCIAIRYFEKTDNFDEIQETICAGYFKKVVKLDDSEIELIAWDTAGAERYRALTPIYFLDASAALIVYSVDNPKSFEALDSFHQLILDKAPDILTYVVGNKIDLENERKIDFFQGKNYADKIHAEGYFEVSALTGENIDFLFTEVASNPKLKKKYFEENTAHHELEENEKKHCC